MFYMVMEYLDGAPLDVMLQQSGRLPELTVSLIARHSLAGLTAIHNMDLLHRDIKPGNIMSTTNGDGTQTYKLIALAWDQMGQAFVSGVVACAARDFFLCMRLFSFHEACLCLIIRLVM